MCLCVYVCVCAVWLTGWLAGVPTSCLQLAGGPVGCLAGLAGWVAAASDRPWPSAGDRSPPAAATVNTAGGGGGGGGAAGWAAPSRHGSDAAPRRAPVATPDSVYTALSRMVGR